MTTTLSVPREETARRRSPGLTLARVVWLLFAAMTLLLVVTGIPNLFSQLLANADLRALLNLGLSPAAYAGYLTALNLIVVGFHAGIAALIFFRRPNDWVVLFVAFTLIANGSLIALRLMYAGEPLPGLGQFFLDLIVAVGLISGVTLLYIFPDGYFVPRWTVLMAAVWAVLMILAVFAPEASLSLPNWSISVQFLVLLIWSGTGVLAQIYRYYNAASPVQQQQIKWSMLGLSLAAMGPFGYFLPSIFVPFIGGSEVPNILYQRAGATLFTFSLALQLLSWTIFTLILLIFPLSFVIAVLRYRLWDIDYLINRTLVYGVLTGTLVIVYLVSVVALQRFTPGESQIAVVLSTLAIAALFNPLRLRIQDGIDRRFYRRKYDMEKAMADFQAAIRDEVNLDEVSEAVVEVVQTTMQPASMSLWLRDDIQS